jgi:hypothetical protein
MGMEILRRPALFALFVLGAMASSAGGAGAAIRVGATALEAHAQGAQDCFGSTLYVQAASQGVSYVIPGGGGVLTSWSAHGFGQPAPLVLKIVRQSAPGSYLITASSPTETVAASGSSTFPTRLPVAGGDQIALWVPDTPLGKAPCNYYTGSAGDVQAYGFGVSPEPSVGEEFGPTSDQGSGFRLNLSAQLEPDADRDGYGDETQDECPAGVAAHAAPCPDRTAPETTITRARINQGKRRAKFRFSASERGSSFECALDGRGFRPCGSPKSYGELKPGKHRFRVAAVDGADNRDRSPAVKRFELDELRGSSPRNRHW